MRNLILPTLSILALLIYPLSLSAQNSFSLSLDVDGSAGDQTVTSLNTAPNQVVAIEIFGKDIQNANGLAVRVIVSSSGGSTTNVDIPDTNLRAVIENSLGKASGALITRAEMASLMRLESPNSNISDLTGLEFATNLTRLDLGAERVYRREVSSTRQGFVRERSNLANSNEISNLSPLSGMARLERLGLVRNTISDLTPLSNLNNLEMKEDTILSGGEGRTGGGL